MPAIAHWPTMIKASSSSAEVVSAMDVLPSVERLVSGTKSTTLDLDGKVLYHHCSSPSVCLFISSLVII